MKFKNNNKKLSQKRRGDTLRVSLSNQGRPYYEKQVNVNHQKYVDQLFDELEFKGIKRSKKQNNTSWFD